MAWRPECASCPACVRPLKCVGARETRLCGGRDAEPVPSRGLPGSPFHVEPGSRAFRGRRLPPHRCRAHRRRQPGHRLLSGASQSALILACRARASVRRCRCPSGRVSVRSAVVRPHRADRADDTRGEAARLPRWRCRHVVGLRGGTAVDPAEAYPSVSRRLRHARGSSDPGHSDSPGAPDSRGDNRGEREHPREAASNIACSHKTFLDWTSTWPSNLWGRHPFGWRFQSRRRFEHHHAQPE